MSTRVASTSQAPRPGVTDTEARPTSPPSVLRYVKPYRMRLVFGTLMLLCTNVLDKSIPLLLMRAVDSLHEGSWGAVRTFALWVVLVAACMWVFRTASRILMFNVGRDVEFDLRNEVLQRLHELGPSFFTRMPTGDIMSRAINDLGQVRLLVGFGGLNLMNTIFAYGAALAMMVSLSWDLALWSLLPYPIIALLTRSFSRAMFKRSREAQEALGSLADRAQENVAGIRLVRAYGLEAYERRRFEEANQRALQKNMSLAVIRGVMWPVLMTVASLAGLVVVWVGGGKVLEGTLSVGEFAAFNAYVAQLVWPTLSLGFLMSVLQRGRASYGRVREVLDAVPDVVEQSGAAEAGREGRMRTAGLTYRYGSSVALDSVDIEVGAGESLAIVGRTGAGKSTLAALLPRLLPTPSGSVFLDDEDVTALQLGSLRRRVGYAQQEPFLFSTTVEQNIALALDDPSAPDAADRVRRAAELAAIHEDIERLPEGYATVVGERGVQLSGGQKQRVALARALLNEPRVLILDDPLSAVDAKTEAQILSALDRAKENRTLILVTNRIAAAARTERIVVLDRGKVVERGSHDELVAAGGIYAQLAKRQRLERELEAL